jgi:cobalt-zinc-cadmium efflux system outer membrane protein
LASAPLIPLFTVIRRVRRGAKGWLWGGLGLALAVSGRGQSAATEPPLTLSQAVEIALAANPGLAASRLQPEVARAGIEVARQRPNPELTIEETNEAPHDAATWAQAFETAGKRRRRIALAEAGVAVSEAELARAVAELRNRVRRAFYSLVAAQRRRIETASRLELAERTREVAQARFESGDVPRLDVLQMELAAAQADNDLQEALSLERAAQNELNLLLARSLAAPTEVRGTLEEGTIPVATILLQETQASNLELAALDRGIAEQQARVALARAERMPDPVLQGTVTHRAAPEFDWGWHAAVTLPLPLFRRSAALQVEERTLDQLVVARAARAGEIAAAADAARTRTAAQWSRVERFRDQVLPRAEEIESLAKESYRSGQTGLPALLQALQATREVRLQAIQAGADYQTALAELESAMGVSLP